ncbi:MAG: hypothetical protein HY314_11370 [Acidobacteria bacterium]|nr:hypothetical protein [Acidobacteriota bacterium]
MEVVVDPFLWCFFDFFFLLVSVVEAVVEADEEGEEVCEVVALAGVVLAAFCLVA